MHYQLYYSGQPGNISASITNGGKTFDTTTGLKDKKDAEKWAARVARDHKVENTPEPTEYHSVSISGGKTFTV